MAFAHFLKRKLPDAKKRVYSIPCGRSIFRGGKIAAGNNELLIYFFLDFLDNDLAPMGKYAAENGSSQVLIRRVRVR